MAYATELTIGTGSKVTLHYNSQEVSVALTYELEREDTNVLAIVQAKAQEVARAHQSAWERIRDAKTEKTQSREEEAEASQHSGDPEAAPPLVIAPSSTLSSGEDETATAGQQSALQSLLSHIGWNEEQIMQHLTTHFACSSIDYLTQRQAAQWLLDLQRSEREKAQQRRSQVAQLNGKQDSQ